MYCRSHKRIRHTSQFSAISDSSTGSTTPRPSKVRDVITQTGAWLTSAALYDGCSQQDLPRQSSWDILVTRLNQHSWDLFINSLASGWFLRFSQKNSSFRLPYQRPSSSADCTRELFNGSNGSASLVDCTRKKIFWLGGADCLWVTS